MEVHIFIGEIPPPPEPPEHKKVDPSSRPPLPGGKRFGRWAVAAPGGATFTVGPSLGPFTVGATIGVNFFFVRNEETKEERKYAGLALGAGVSVGPPAKFASLRNLLQTLATGPNFSGVSFEPVFPPHPVTWEEVDSCFVEVVGGNAELFNPALSVAAAVITFTCPELWEFGQSGLPIHAKNEEI